MLEPAQKYQPILFSQQKFILKMFTLNYSSTNTQENSHKKTNQNNRNKN